uniref:Uncharacterized LOC107376715 n=1 Tax=Nothobranchius furzeri TaxID=105023 RepID=A0A8C6P116_NOTFU
EREDLEKFTFSFDVFFGNPKAMTPGVRVHFTQNRSVATDVKVAPGGTENVDPEIYEAVVPGERLYPGQVNVVIGMVRTNLPFEKKDSTVTLLKNDLVLINLLTDIVTEKRRATNIKPKIPATFGSTNEIREKGVIFSLNESEGVIKSNQHDLLPFDPKENFSDIEFTEEDINEEVDFTVIMVRPSCTAVRRSGAALELGLNSLFCSCACQKKGGKVPDSKYEISKERFEGTVLRASGAEVTEPAKEPADAERGQLVMTVDGGQKKLNFGPKDLLTMATMLAGDKVRFNIATHQETKEERATFVEILSNSFEESPEQRQHGIVIEFSEGSGLIKCSQNPQLYFHMSEVMEKKKLELNEKVVFSIVPHETAEGGQQAIRVKRFSEKVFLPARKLGGVSKGKVSSARFIVLCWSRSRSRSRSRARSTSPPRDKFGRLIKRKRSTSPERKSSRYRQSGERSHRRIRSCSRSRSKSSSRSRSRERSKDRFTRKRSKTSREREDQRRRELTPPHRQGGVVDSELARKKRELEELNEMIAYKKSLVDLDPRALEPGKRTCIDYDHGRITMPLTEYKPVRSILKKRPEEPGYHQPPYNDPYYEQPYSPYQGRYGECYSDPYAGHPYSERPYGDRLYSHRYEEPPYGRPPSSSHCYTDRYNVYDEPYDDQYYDPADGDRPYDPYSLVKEGPSTEPHGSSPPSRSGRVPGGSARPPLTHSADTSSSHSSYRPPSPIDSPPRTPSPKRKAATQSPPTEKPPLDRFLDMLTKKVVAEKKPGPTSVTDDLLPHERALQDGKGFSRIVGLAQEPPSSSLAKEEKERLSPKRSSAERAGKEQKTEPYGKIESLLRSIGLKLSSGEVSKLASKAQETILSTRSSSTEKETFSSAREERRASRTGSVELDHLRSLSPARSSSLEPLSRQKPTSAPHSSKSSIGTSGHSAAAQPQQKLGFPPGPPPGPPPRRSSQQPPGPPPGPPPQRPPGQPPFSLPLIGKPNPSPPPSSSSSSHLSPTAMVPPPPKAATSSSASSDQSAISTTVARCLKVIETVKSLSVQPLAKQGKSVQFSLPTEPVPSIGPLTPADTEDEIKAKQKEKSVTKFSADLFSLFFFLDKPLSEPKNVWICGHSLIYWAESRAKSPEVGMQLGMDPSKVTIWWKGTQGMTWSQLLPQLHQLKITWPNPEVLIIHLGGNDLSTESPTNLLASVKKDMTSIRSIFPRCVLVWSNILPRRVWRHSSDSHEVDLVRTTVNRRIQNIMSELGGISLSHDNIRCGTNTGLYRGDGIRLSPKGIDVFNLNLQEFLEKWELDVNSE